MKKYLQFLTIAMTVVMVIFSCSNDNLTTTTNENESKTIDQKTLALGKMIAMSKIEETMLYGDTTWTEDTQISDYYPIYTAGIDGVSHIEFKLQTKGQDAGYILVSVTENDLLVPECAEQGESTTEIYRNALGRSDFNVYRYNWFESAAEQQNTGRGEPVVLASIGFDGNGLTVHSNGRGVSEMGIDYAKLKSEYAKKVKEKQCLPFWEKADLATYYDNQQKAGRGEIESTVYGTSKLKHKFIDEKINNKWLSSETPLWNQSTHSDGSYMGCSVVAWGEVFAYWRQFKGKTKLFSKISNMLDCKIWEGEKKTNNGKILYDELCKIADYCKTNNGGTFVGNTYLGLKYAGYSDPFACYSNGIFTWTNGFTDVSRVFSEIDNDRPVMLCICSHGVGELNHTVVINKARKTYYPSTGFVEQYEYDINLGWGDSGTKWISFYGTSCTSIYDAYFINLK